MQRRSYMAFVVAMVYLMTLAAQFAAQVVCTCAERSHAASVAVSCCKSNCCASAHTCDGERFEHRCCRADRALVQSLYLAASDDEMRRLLPLVLQVALVGRSGEEGVGLSTEGNLDRIGPPLGPLSEGGRSACGLRAPPVMA